MNSTPIEVELSIYDFVDAKTLYGVNRASTRIALGRIKKATRTIQRAIHCYLLVKRWVKERKGDIDDYECLCRFVHKRFYPLMYRTDMMRLALRKVLRNDDERRAKVQNLIKDNNRSIAERYNEFIDLLSYDMILINGW